MVVLPITRKVALIFRGPPRCPCVRLEESINPQSPSMGMRRRRSSRPSKGSKDRFERTIEVTEKLAKASAAKTDQGRWNYLIDSLHAAGAIDRRTDRLLHLVNEYNHGKGSAAQKLLRWAKKSRKYKR